MVSKALSLRPGPEGNSTLLGGLQQLGHFHSLEPFHEKCFALYWILNMGQSLHQLRLGMRPNLNHWGRIFASQLHRDHCVKRQDDTGHHNCCPCNSKEGIWIHRDENASFKDTWRQVMKPKVPIKSKLLRKLINAQAILWLSITSI